MFLVRTKQRKESGKISADRGRPADRRRSKKMRIKPSHAENISTVIKNRPKPEE